MKITYIITAILALSVSVWAEGASETSSSGPAETRSLAVSGFTAVECGGGISLMIAQDKTISAQARGARADLEALEYRVEGSTLKIGRKPGFFFSDHGPVTINITMPLVQALRLSGGVTLDLRFDARNTPGVGIDLSGGSEISGTLLANGVNASLSGGSKIRLDGFAAKISAIASGGSAILGREWAFADATLELNGGSHAELAVRDSIRISASGGSQVGYRGKPASISQNLSGGSTVYPIN